MSLTSKIALATSVIFTAGIVSYVHGQQVKDKEVHAVAHLSLMLTLEKN